MHFNPKGIHWKNGFYLPRPAVEAEYPVSLCCLKTHQYGGIFTMSLKLSVGLTPKKLMRELHSSKLHMRKMIAELNQPYSPQLVVKDGAVQIPADPGWGVEISQNWLKSAEYQKSET